MSRRRGRLVRLGVAPLLLPVLLAGTLGDPPASDDALLQPVAGDPAAPRARAVSAEPTAGSGRTAPEGLLTESDPAGGPPPTDAPSSPGTGRASHHPSRTGTATTAAPAAPDPARRALAHLRRCGRLSAPATAPPSVSF